MVALFSESRTSVGDCTSPLLAGGIVMSCGQVLCGGAARKAAVGVDRSPSSYPFRASGRADSIERAGGLGPHCHDLQVDRM